MFDYAFEVLHQNEFWADSKGRIMPVKAMTPSQAQNAINYISKNSSDYRDSFLRWFLNSYRPETDDKDHQAYKLIRDSPSIEFVYPSPLYKSLKLIAEKKI